MDISALVTHCYDVLKNQQDLSPANPIINAVLGEYVTGIANANVQDNLHVLSDKGVVGILPALRDKLSQSEYCMECYYAERFNGMATIRYEDLSHFIYWDNYLQLADKEMALLHNVLPHDKECDNITLVFVGSGPLPMSALIMMREGGYRVECVDCDKTAVDVSVKLINNLGLQGKISITQQDGALYNYTDADIVVIASLIPDKEAVLKAIKQSRGDRPTYILVRSAEDLNTLLYCPFKEGAFNTLCFKCLGKTEYCPKTINTSLLYEV